MADYAGAAIGAAGGLFGAAGQVASTSLNTFGNLLLSQMEFQRNKRLIQEQNAYNSPLQQLKRYEEAGLNPNLIYGEGKASAGNQTEVARYKAPDLNFDFGQAGNYITQAVAGAMNTLQQKADLDIKHQQVENLKEEQLRIRADRHSQDIKNMWDSFLYGFDPGLVTQVGDYDKIKNSPGFHRYDAQLRSIENLMDYRNANIALANANAALAGASKDQKEWYTKNILPLMEDIMDKRSKNLDVTNELLNLQKQFFVPDKIAGYSQQLISAIAQFISPFKGGSPALSPYGPGSTWSW